MIVPEGYDSAIYDVNPDKVSKLDEDKTFAGVGMARGAEYHHRPEAELSADTQEDLASESEGTTEAHSETDPEAQQVSDDPVSLASGSEANSEPTEALDPEASVSSPSSENITTARRGAHHPLPGAPPRA
jgi:hypothetical protein